MIDNPATEGEDSPFRAVRGAGRGVRLIDVANAAGVSVATASRSLRGVAKVSPATRERVLDAARELSYGVAPRLFEAQPAQPGAPVVAVILPFFSRW